MNTSSDGQAADALLSIQGLCVTFSGRRRTPLPAVQNVNLAVAGSETVGLVGESGSGKTTLARAVLGMVPRTAGTIRFEGADITRADRRARRELSRHMQMVFQDPYRSLSPTRTIGETLVEPLMAHGAASLAEARRAGAEMLERVGLPHDAARKYPREFSGGQRQRIAIARALMLRPKLVICDEPVSALDLSIQAQVLNLLRSLQAELGLSYLFVAHNLSVVRFMSRRVYVLYRGQVMESGEAAALYEAPGHPYTRMLLDAAPVADPALQAAHRRRDSVAQSSAVTSVNAVGCPFRPRCAYAVEQCEHERPPLAQTDRGSTVACFRAAELPVYVRRSAPTAPATRAAGSPGHAPGSQAR